MKRRIPVGRSVAGALVALLVSAGAGSVPARAEVKLGAPFSDGAVLQRGQPVRVWGTAVAGEKVSVSFGGRSAVATADASGAWRTELPAFEASKEPRTLVARAVSGEAKAEDVLASNLVYRLKTGPVHQNYGRDNVFENNIFAFGGDEQIKRSSPKGPDGTTNACSFVFRNNIVYFDKPDGFAFARTQAITNTGYLADLVFERNVWWCEGGLAPKAFECMDWAAWQALGKDRGSLVADPLFADPGKGDFTLRDGSPALKTGFVPWDVGKAGLYDDRRYWGSGADYWLRLFRGGGSPH